jgi:hypothetical protein
LGRFNQPDTVTPTSSQGSQAWDRLAYVNNNPILHNDPSGHCFNDTCSPDTHTSPAPPNSGGNCGGAGNYAPECQSGGTQASIDSNDGTTSTESGDGNNNRDATLTEISNVFQDISTGLSAIGAGMEDAGLAIGGPEGFVAGTIMYNGTGLNLASTISSAISTTATIINEHGLDDKSSTSLVLTLVGAINPVANLDVVINGWASAYNRGQAPGINSLINTASDVIGSVIDVFK